MAELMPTSAEIWDMLFRRTPRQCLRMAASEVGACTLSLSGGCRARPERARGQEGKRAREEREEREEREQPHEV